MADHEMNELDEYLALIEREREHRPAEAKLADEIRSLRAAQWPRQETVMAERDVAWAENAQLKEHLRRYGGHKRFLSKEYPGCRTRLNGTGGNYGYYDEECDCGWDEISGPLWDEWRAQRVASEAQDT